MSRTKKPAPTTPETPEQTPEATKTVVVRKPVDWGALLKAAEADHWRTLRVTIKIRDKLMAGKPAALDAAKAMIKARGYEDVLAAQSIPDPNAAALVSDDSGEIAAAAPCSVCKAKAKAPCIGDAGPLDTLVHAARQRASEAEAVKDEGLCEFHRREGKPGIWMPSNHLKAGLKENWSVLGFRVEHRGSRGALAEAVFVFGPDKADREWIPLGIGPDGVDTNVCHTTGPSGPMSSIKRHEFVRQPTITFIVQIAQAIAAKLPEDALARTLYHFSRHGVGANRSQGAGTFDIVGIEEIEGWGDPAAVA